MILFVFIAAFISLIDISGAVLNDKILPLVYVIDVEDMKKDDSLGNVSNMSSEELAQYVKNKIFEKGEETDNESNPK